MFNTTLRLFYTPEKRPDIRSIGGWVDVRAGLYG
jgi:hypothetical protein